MAEEKDKGYDFRLDDLSEAVFVVSPDGLISEVNKVGCDLLGCEEPGLVGKEFGTLFADVPTGLLRVFKGRDYPHELVANMRHEDGQNILVDFFVSPVERDGRVETALYIGRDIRVKKLLGAELRKARDYFRAVVEYSPGGICITDLSRKIILANKAVEELTGYQVDKLISKSVERYYPTGDPSVELDIDALRKGEAVTKEIEFVKKDGSKVPVRVYYRLIEGADLEGDDVIIEAYSDLTTRRKLDKLKDEFVFIAAHELRNPATAIKLMLDIIFEDKRVTIDPILRNYLLKVQQAEERLMQLVDDLLEVSKTEIGRLQIKVNTENMVDHVKEIVSELKPSALSRDITLRYSPPSSLPTVLADGAKLKEILSNLVSNAIKYNVSGGSVTVSHEVKDDSVITHVSDTGIGMSMKDAKMIGEKFWRSEDLAVQAQAGTGLGVFIVKELVNRMGGDFSVNSKHGEGSVFTFSLPSAPYAAE